MNWAYIEHKYPVFKRILRISGAKEALEWLSEEYSCTVEGRRILMQEEVDFMRDEVDAMELKRKGKDG